MQIGLLTLVTSEDPMCFFFLLVCSSSWRCVELLFFFLEDEALCNCFCDAEGEKCVCLSTLPPSLYFPRFTFCLILVLHMCFFIERFLLFWEICSGSNNKGGLGAVRDRKKRGKKGILRGAALHPFVSVRVAFAVFAVGLPSLTGGSNQRYTVPFFF